MADPAIKEAAARALRNRAAEIHVQSQGTTDPDVMWFADTFALDVLTAVTPLIEAAALERAAQVADEWTGRAAYAIAADIRALKQEPAPRTDCNVGWTRYGACKVCGADATGDCQMHTVDVT